MILERWIDALSDRVYGALFKSNPNGAWLGSLLKDLAALLYLAALAYMVWAWQPAEAHTEIEPLLPKTSREEACQSIASTYAVIHSMLSRGASDEQALSTMFTSDEQTRYAEPMARLIVMLRAWPAASHDWVVPLVYWGCMGSQEDE